MKEKAYEVLGAGFWLVPLIGIVVYHLFFGEPIPAGFTPVGDWG